MIQSGRKFLNRLTFLSDILMLFLSYEFASWFYLEVLNHNRRNMATRDGLSLVFTAIGIILFAVLGLYDRKHLRLRQQFRIVAEALALELLALVGYFFILHLDDFSRGVLAWFFLTALVLVCLARLLIVRLALRIVPRQQLTRHILVVGTGPLAREYVANQRKADLDLLDEIRVIDGHLGRDTACPEYLGGIDRLDELLSGGIDEVVAALDIGELDQLKQVIACCERHGTRISVIPFYNDIMPANPAMEVVGTSKLMNLRSNPLDNVGLATLKRVFDILVSAFLLLVLSPFLLVVALGTKLSSPGPVFFRQERVGLHKKTFIMYKFRSMRVTDTENTGWTTDADPRKTPFGTFIRKFSIDELPQLFNVLKGDMSLIGPRPEIPFYVEQFKDTVPLYMVKHQVRPGMTGWAQVNGYRGDTSIPKRIEHDVWYIEHWSVRLDIRILWMTAFGGFMNSERRSGAVTEPAEETRRRVTVGVAIHKPYAVATDPMYLPLQVGAAGKPSLGWQRDDEGDNISEKNPTFCELTGLYWLWKHCDAEAVGLCHYRRYFIRRRLFTGRWEQVLTGEQAEKLLKECPVILPKKRHYWIETNRSQYDHAHHPKDLDETRAILVEQYGDRAGEAFDRTMERSSGHRFNMFLMRREAFEDWCGFLFGVLFELEKRLDISDYSQNDRRVFGFVGERLMDVWLEMNGREYKECSYAFMERQNWPKKILSFLKRKLKG